MSRALLITGATGNQGGAVIDALIAKQPSDFLLLAVTRNAQSASAKRLAAKSPQIKLVEGDLDAVPALFRSAKEAAATVPLWGVYSVQVSMGKGVTLDGEVRQGKAMVDESIKAGVQHFVYSSVERGGEEQSWDNPTPVPHFKTKHEIEHHLRDSTAGGKNTMGWTILRPVIFMDNLTPGFPGKVFLTMLRDTIKDKPLQWIATQDIGFFAAEAFHNPSAWHKRAIGLAGDELTFSQLSQTFRTVTGQPVGTTYSLLGKALKHGVSEMGVMVEWFKNEGYGANVAEIRKLHPRVTTMEAWLKKSAFANSG
ncbi:NmrA-like family domain-containing protein [Paramyrothecium foliicola]|nr:NmrA-like family domain-containing protein [Paramyrothecium foliicola]